MDQIESETRQRPNDSKTIDPLDLDLPSIIQRLNGCSFFLSLIERESEAVLLHLRQAHEAILDLQTKSPRLGEVTHTLVRHVDFLIDSRKNLFLRLQNLQRRSQMQLAFVCSCPQGFFSSWDYVNRNTEWSGERLNGA
jgi:hypothetical protein